MTNGNQINQNLIDEYIKNAPNKRIVHYWDLPEGLCARVKNLPKDLKLRGPTKTISIGRLKRNFGKDPHIDRCIKSIVNWRNKRHEFRINMPLSLINKDYVKIYSLMLSEGSYRTEFKLQVPEEEFHQIFANCLRRLFDGVYINCAVYNGVKLSTAPEKMSYLLPIPPHIPRFILDNKDLARLYLRIAFEAEANFRYKILGNGAVNRRIKLSRNTNIENLVKEKLPYKEEERIYFSRLKKDFPELAIKILKNPCPTILGERILLKKHFGIDTSFYPEYLRINKTNFRKGKIVAKWTLNIFSVNINKFVKEVGCITEHKRNIAKNMLKVKLQRPRYFALGMMKKVANNDVFDSNYYANEMLKLGYKFPRVFLAKYRKRNLIKKIGVRKYRIL